MVIAWGRLDFNEYIKNMTMTIIVCIHFGFSMAAAFGYWQDHQSRKMKCKMKWEYLMHR